MIDYLIAGAGLFGAVFAHEACRRGKTCLVVEKRPHIGGNVYTETVRDINVHRYGAHIFHTSDKTVWNYVRQFAKFNNFINAPVAVYHNELYNLPFNMNTFNKLWGVKTPAEAKAVIERQRAESGVTEPRNLEEQALLLAGRDIYEKLIKEYTEKQWGKPCAELPAFIIKRLPFRWTFDNNYFNDPCQGIPIGGWTPIVGKLLAGCEVRLNTDYFDFIKKMGKNEKIAEKTVFTGPIDEFFGYRFGELEYRSLRFETEILETDNYQGAAVVNYTDKETPWTRIIEHKHFEFGRQPCTVITREYPGQWKRGGAPYYPVNDAKNTALYQKYRTLADERDDVVFGGRLGQYAYYDMDKVIADALETARKEAE